MPGIAGELLGDPKAVRDDREVDPAAARRRCRATASAVVLASKAMLSPSTTMLAASRPIRSFASGWRRSRTSNALSGRLPAAAIAPPWVRIEPALALEDLEVLADRDRRDAEPRGEIADTGSAVLLDEPGDQLLAFRGEWGTGLVPGVHRRRPSLVGRCFDLLRKATLDDAAFAMSRR